MLQVRKKSIIKRLCVLMVLQMLLPVALCAVFGDAGVSSALAAAPLQITRGSNSCFIKKNPKDMTFALSFALDDSNSPTVIAAHLEDPISIRLERKTMFADNDYSFAHGTTTWIDVFLINATTLSTLPCGPWELRISYPNGQNISIPFYILEENTIIFTQQPEDALINEGESATFTVAVTGSSGYSYQWQRLSRTGWKNLSGKTSRTLTITNTDGINGWQYRCLVHSNAGDAYSDAAKVRIYSDSMTPATGDQSMPLLYALCAAVSLCIIVGCVLVSCRKKPGCHVKH